MLISKEVTVTWNNMTKKWFESKGYIYTKMRESFLCKVEDLKPTFTTPVEVKCDYCGKVHMKDYRDYLNSRSVIQKDCCSNRKCMVAKSEEVHLKLYGVRNAQQRNSIKEKTAEKQRVDWDLVVDVFKNKGLILLSKKDDYKNYRSPLKFVCPIHKDRGVQTTTYSNIKRCDNCCYYGGMEAIGNSKRLDGSLVVNLFLEKDYTPLFDTSEYQNNSTPLPFICNKHPYLGEQTVRYGNLQSGEGGCSECASENRRIKMMLNEDDVFDYFKSRGLLVSENQSYNGKDELIECTCAIHQNNTFEISYNGLTYTDIPCAICREDNANKSIRSRIRGLVSWKNKSKEKWNFKCIITNSSSFEVHHLHSVSLILNEALSELNYSSELNSLSSEQKIILRKKVYDIQGRYPLGVCLHPKIHRLFHSKYGREVTELDFIDFCNKYIEGVFDQDLPNECKSNYKQNINNIQNYILNNCPVLE